MQRSSGAGIDLVPAWKVPCCTNSASRSPIPSAAPALPQQALTLPVPSASSCEPLLPLLEDRPDSEPLPLLSSSLRFLRPGGFCGGSGPNDLRVSNPNRQTRNSLYSTRQERCHTSRETIERTDVLEANVGSHTEQLADEGLGKFHEVNLLAIPVKILLHPLLV